MRRTILATALLSVLGAAHASDSDKIAILEKQVKVLERQSQASDWTDRFNISGFGSLGLGMANNDAGYAGYTDKHYDFLPDSMIAVQMDFHISERTKAVIQLTSAGKYDWEPAIEWAYLSHEFDAFTLRGGKLRAPMYMLSDYLDVGYSYPMARPSTEVYETLPVNSFTGVDAIIPIDAGDAIITFQPLFGQSEIAEKDSQGEYGKVELNNLLGLATTLQYEDFTFRLSYLVAEAANSSTLRLSPSVDGEHGTFAGIGMQYDNGSLIVLTEGTQVKLDGQYPDSQSAYALLGYRINSVTPYLMAANVSSQDNNKRSGLRSTIFDYKRSTYSAGLRWDAMANIALKFDLSYSDFAGTSGKLPTNMDLSGLAVGQAPVILNDDSMVYSVVLDFVF